MEDEYMFTTDWFTGNMDNFATVLREFVNQANVQILEIGSWEGRSATWFLSNIPNSHITCIDTFLGGEEHANMQERHGVEERFLHNTRRFGDRVTVRKGDSRTELFGLVPETYDIIYVDGSHEAPDVLRDVVMSFHLLKVGGIMLMDDYARGAEIREENRLHHPQPAINMFLDLYQEKMYVIHMGYQVYIRKTAS